MTLLLQHSPSWTDQVQAWAALIGVPATIIGIIVLLIRDRHKENQIQKLGDIAGQLNQMLADSEKRYIQTRKPIIDIKIHNLVDMKSIKLEFHNFNQTSHVQYYEPIDLPRDKYDIVVDNLTSKKQEFGILFNYDESPIEYNRSVIHIKYITTEGYTFKQILRFYVSAHTIEVDKDPIL